MVALSNNEVAELPHLTDGKVGKAFLFFLKVRLKNTLKIDL